MKKILFISLSLIYGFSTYSQSRIIKLNAQTGAFKNSPILPSYEKFSIEGEVQKDIVLVEIDVKESKSKDTYSYYWNRPFTNLSANFEVLISRELLGSARYDFNIRTFKSMEDPAKLELLKNLITKVHSYLNDEIHIDKNELEIDNHRKSYAILNEIVHEAVSLQRSRNGIVIEDLSEIIKDALHDISNVKIKHFLKRKSSESVVELTQHAKDEKVNYITSLILSEVKPFFNSDLVQQYRVFEISDVATEKDQFTLPVNVGAYAWTTSADFNKINAGNSGLGVGLGLTIPIIRNYSIKGKKLPSVGVSLGVLATPIRDEFGVRLSTPGINIPVYAAIGFSFLKVIRLNVGVIAVAPHKVANVTSINWLPTVGLAFELDAWLGIKK